MMIRAVTVLVVASLCGLFSLSANAANNDQAAALKKAGLNGRASDFANFSPDPIGPGFILGIRQLRGGLGRLRTVKRRE